MRMLRFRMDFVKYTIPVLCLVADISYIKWSGNLLGFKMSTNAIILEYEPSFCWKGATSKYSLNLLRMNFLFGVGFFLKDYCQQWCRGKSSCGRSRLSYCFSTKITLMVTILPSHSQISDRQVEFQ